MEQHFCNRLAVSCGPGDIRGSQVSQDKTTNCKQPIDSGLAGLATESFASIGIWSCLPACTLGIYTCLHAVHWLVCIQHLGLFLMWVHTHVYKSKCLFHLHAAFARLTRTLLASRCFGLALCLSTKCLLELVGIPSCQLKFYAYVMQCVSKPE